MDLPKSYASALSVYETQRAIGTLKRTFEDLLCDALRLSRVSAPLFVDPRSGLNDDLNGVEQAVEFEIPAAGASAEIVHSLAKWKRMALSKYRFPVGSGLYTDMNAIRREETLDPLHSVYVDQWDWEVAISRSARNERTLRDAVARIVRAISDTHAALRERFPQLRLEFKPDVEFITAQELEDRYPALTPSGREEAFVREAGTAFVMRIGDALRSGARHGTRAPDYDDWSLNGDILYWHEPLGCAMEISSMGVRVDAETLDRQLVKADCAYRRSYPFHQSLARGELPDSIGGGIGQSRLCMLLLEKAHIGEVQVSLWDPETLRLCEAAGIPLL